MEKKGRVNRDFEYVDAVEREDIERILKLRNEGVICYTDLRIVAARLGKMRVLEWFKGRGHKFTDQVLESAVLCKQHDTVVWLLENGCVADLHVLNLAVDTGSVPMVCIILKSNTDLYFDLEIVRSAVLAGNVIMLLIMSLHGADDYIRECADYAAAADQVQILEIMEAVGVEFTHEDVMAAINAGAFETFKWFILHCKFKVDKSMYEEACEFDHKEISNWIVQMGYASFPSF